MGKMLYFIRDGDSAYFSYTTQKGNEVGRVNWRGTDHTVVLISMSTFSSSSKEHKKTDGIFPILKSNLQKQIRRKDIHAVATCEMMLDLNDFETLRRLD